MDRFGAERLLRFSQFIADLDARLEAARTQPCDQAARREAGTSVLVLADIKGPSGLGSQFDVRLGRAVAAAKVLSLRIDDADRQSRASPAAVGAVDVWAGRLRKELAVLGADVLAKLRSTQLG